MDTHVRNGPRLAPLAENDSAARDPMLDDLVRTLGYRPNALLTMARRPGLLAPILALVQVAAWSEGVLSPAVRLLLACEASRGAQCRYTACHVVHAAHHAGVAWAKLAALPDYAESPLFDAVERHALAIATAGSTLPVGDAGPAFAAAEAVLSEQALIEVVTVIAAFGWFNRWNSLVGTQMEQRPAEAFEHVPWLAALEPGHV